VIRAIDLLKGVCLIAALLLPGLPAGATPGGGSITITDALGRRVTLPAVPRRIVSVAPSVTEILFALGLDARVVGVSSADDSPAERIAGTPHVGGVILDVERIISLRPQLVLGVASLQRGQLERLIAFGLPVVAVDAAALPDVYAQIALIGRLTGTGAGAAHLVRTMRQKEDAVAAAVRGRPRRQVYIELSAEPMMTAGAGTFLSDLVTRAGGVNAFGDLTGWVLVGEEAVILRDPEVIVAAYPHGRRLVLRRGWNRVKAIRTGRVGEVSASLVSRPGPRIVDGLRALAEIIHPEAFGR